MSYLRITENLKKELEPKIKQLFPDRNYSFELNHWHDNRFVQLLTTLNDDFDIHYEYYQGYVELHLEVKYSQYDYNLLWRLLVDKSYNDDNLSWHRWSNRNQGRCRYNKFVQSVNDIIEGFKYLSTIFDPLLKPLLNNHTEEVIEEIDNSEELPAADLMKVGKLTYQVQFIKDLPFENLVIPEYQRAYKWTVKNVNQLINDLIAFRETKEYRLGTLVLNENNIVDGQQRIVTLSLLLYVLFSKQEITEENPYQDVQKKVKTFWKRTKFKNEYSMANVRENLNAIGERIEDLDSSFLYSLLCNCQFVVVQLPKISEAFQFFDSQNARGKDLEPHDLLKAFHLREIKALSYRDSDNITVWQEQKLEHLVNLFLTLFRVKRWSRNRSGREFAKNDVDVFKGITLGDKRYPYYMQQIVCHYFTNVYANDITRQIDNSELEFPFQLDQVCINGSRFFDMIRHYDELYEKIIHSRTFLKYDSEKDQKTAYKIVHLLNTYGNRNRKGDVYVRQLFNCLLIYYVDRFGYDEMNKVSKKIFKYVYRLRLQHYSIQLSTIDNEAMWGAMFKAIRDAKTPYDIINLPIEILATNENSRNADSQLQNIYY